MKNNNVQGQEKIKDVRAAIIVPDRLIKTPGYYLLLGKEEESSEPVFLKEAAEASSEALFSSLVDDEEGLRFHTLYADFSFKTGNALPDFIIQLFKHQKKHIPWVRICPASFFYGNDIKQGIHLLSQWGGRRAVPKGTTLRNQLGKITPDNFEDPALYTFTALRYLMAGFSLEKSSAEDAKIRREAHFKKDSFKRLSGADRAAADEFMRICGDIERQSEFENDILW